MDEFWQLPYGAVVDVPDSELPRLEELATIVGTKGWGVEFDGDSIHFRFKDKEQAVYFGFLNYTGVTL